MVLPLRLSRGALALSALVALAQPPVRGEIVNFVMTLDGPQETPPVNTPASGNGVATLDTTTRLFSWNITFNGLLAPEIAAHFHGPAVACEMAGVALALPLGNPKVGSATLSVAQMNDVLAGRWYVNIHSGMHGGGEIRGQVYPAPFSNPLPNIANSSTRVILEFVATGLTAPNWATHAPGVPGRLFIVDQPGRVESLDLASGTRFTFIDVSSLLVPLGIFGPGSFDERGLLGLAFRPDYATSGKFYTYTSEPVSGAADYSTQPIGVPADHQSVIREWTNADPTNPLSVVAPAGSRVLLRVDEPQFNHNAGCINFGADGMLYIAFGDGGGADDTNGQPFIGGDPLIGHGCRGNGQNLATPLGKILRIDPLGNNSANGQYGIPANNPFVGVGGAAPEIFARGFRNPFRFSFDPQTGELYAADVGQNDIEEINIVTSGGNYGWRHREGSFNFIFNGNSAGYITDRTLDVPAGLIDPIAQYDHGDGIAIVGGFVYRGGQVPDLLGDYVFGEFAVSFADNGRLFHLRGGAITELVANGQPELGVSVLGFGRDGDGEVYLLANTGGVPFGNSGVALRVRSARGDANCDGSIDFFDIDPFLQALFDTPGYLATFPACDGTIFSADANRDGSIDFFDIDAFLDALF